MAWFRNTKTGLCWEVSGRMAERLAADPAFVQVAEPATVQDAASEVEESPSEAAPRRGRRRQLGSDD